MAGEFFRGGVHFLTGSLALSLALYNGMRLTEEPEARTHLWVNLTAYSALFGLEAWNTWAHWRGGR